MSLDTIVDNPGILSGQTLAAKSQMVHGQQNKEKKGKRRNRSYKLVVKHRYTRTRRGIKRAFEICVQMMRKREMRGQNQGVLLTPKQRKWRKRK
jgi:hypothetical protein